MKKIYAKAVYRSNCGVCYKGGLSVKMLVVRVLRESFFYGLSNPLLHFPSRRPCECNHKDPVNIHGMAFVRNERKYPLDKHRGLSASCRRRHQKVASPVLYDSPLAFCPFMSISHPVHPLQPLSSFPLSRPRFGFLCAGIHSPESSHQTRRLLNTRSNRTDFCCPLKTD